jgi:3'-phosphoadenosine 5'-phosphosulfate sulfotransferase (PAPS reductase)/FAD synthetase
MKADDLPLLFDSPEYKVALSYSGGKDSSVLLDLCRPYKDRFAVFWINTGYAFPQIRQHVINTTQGFSFQEITHDLQPHWERDGIPTHILPVDHASLAVAKAKKPYLQNWMACCTRRMGTAAAVLKSQGFNLVLDGQRASDLASGWPRESLIDGMLFVSPLWDWTDGMIEAYIAEHSIKLPLSSDANDTSMECWHCPASIDRPRIEFVKKHYPEYLPVIRETALPVLEAIKAQLDETAKVLG